MQFPQYVDKYLNKRKLWNYVTCLCFNRRTTFIFYKNMCKSSLAANNTFGLLKPQFTFHKHVSNFLRMMRPVVSVVALIQALCSLIRAEHHDLKML